MAVYSDLSENIPDTNPSVWESRMLLRGLSVNNQECDLDRELRTMLEDVWGSKRYSDIIVCAGASEFKVHRLVLAAHSRYLKPKLSEPRVNVDLEPDVLRLVLQYLYQRKVDIPKGDVRRVWEAAGYLGIDVLQRQCLWFLMKDQGVTSDNCLEMWTILHSVSNDHMASKSLEVALKGFQSLQYTPHFLSMSSDLLKEYLLHDQLDVPSPEGRLSAAVRWTLQDPKSRQRDLSEILDLLPLSEMNKWVLTDIIHNPLLDDVKVHAKLSGTLQE